MIISVGGKDSLVYTAHAQIFLRSRGTETDMSIYYPSKSTTAMATA